MTTPEPGAPPTELGTRAPRLPWLRSVSAHALTAIIAVAVSLGLQNALRPAPAQVTPAPSVTPNVSPSATPGVLAPTASPPTPGPPLDTNIARQELADLRAEVDRLWTVSYLSRALIYLNDAETALRGNDWDAVNQSLLAVDDSLMLSYSRADESIKSPIEQIRVEIDRTRNDLYLRPEGMDTRLNSLRQTILALVEARR